jgi:DNA-binding LacI/PurR family transcriptional regulator
MSITMHDVARLAGVSIKTVSNVVNDYPHIRPETRDRVNSAIDELGYRPNLIARGLRSGRTGVISLIIPDLRNAYFAELADVVMRAADAQGLSVIIEQSGADREREIGLLGGERKQKVDGILYSALALGDDDAHILNDVTTPLVLLGERIFHGPTDHVTMRNTEGARAATEHLIELGRRRIAVVGADPGGSVGSATLRLAGYTAALAAAGIPFDGALVAEAPAWSRSGGAEAARALLGSGVAFDGLVGLNDSLALGAMRVLQEAGLRVPHDVAVVGYDDIDETRYSLPTLTTIDPGMREIAEIAVRFLVERIAETGVAVAPREHLADFRLVVRESTALSRA